MDFNQFADTLSNVDTQLHRSAFLYFLQNLVVCIYSIYNMYYILLYIYQWSNSFLHTL